MSIAYLPARNPDGVLQMPSTTGEIITQFTASFQSKPVSIQFHKAFGFQFVLSGSQVASPPTGNVQISGSLDGVNYVGLEALTAFTGFTGSLYRSFDANPVKYVLAKMIYTAGSSNVSGSIFFACI